MKRLIESNCIARTLPKIPKIDGIKVFAFYDGAISYMSTRRKNFKLCLVENGSYICGRFKIEQTGRKI